MKKQKPITICEICQSNVPLDEHHIWSRTYDKQKKHIHETCFVCPNCHRKIHTGLIIIEGRFSTTKGKELIWRHHDEQSITGLPDPIVYIYKYNEL